MTSMLARLHPDALPPWGRRTLLALPWLLVTALALVLLWPVPAGRMPLSADHTVHLTRIWMFAEQLAQGQLRGWSTVWFFGTPVGELYPVLGDLVIVAIRALSFGTLSWPQCYAFGFFLVFAAQGWAMLRVGRALGLGPIPGLVAAVLVLADVGAYREGGWMYTTVYGVWPQALCTALTWLCLGELCVACETGDPLVRRRRIATAALTMAAALLAHPMAMLSLAIGGPLLVLTLGVRSRAHLRRTAVVALLGAVLGIAAAAWWVVPMLQHRAWMASYGWMWQPLEAMAAQLAEGHWSQHMPTAVGAVIGLGLGALAVLGTRTARFFAAFALLQWLLTSRDLMWWLRLDQLDEGFAHIQYQRFLIAAKPGLMLAAGAGLAMLGRAAMLAWGVDRHEPPDSEAGAETKRGGEVPVRSETETSAHERPAWRRPLAAALMATAVGLGAWMLVQQRETSREHRVGEVMVERIPDQPDFDADYAALLQWMAERHAADQADPTVPPYRATVIAGRNQHWFMDAPAFTGMPLYKQGFTPGDNFVHKPESGRRTLLDRLRVRYVISTGRRGSRADREVARFGRLRVRERGGWDAQPIAWLDGPGTLEVLEDDVAAGVVRVRIRDAGEGTRVVFGVAGFPRWTLHQDGREVEWIEVPVIGNGPTATQAERRAGQLRGGKAHGDDGSEPTLIAADVTDGELALRYHPRRTTDVLAGLLSLASLVACGLLLWRPRRWAAPTRVVQAVVERGARLVHPLVLLGLALLLLLGALVRHHRAAAIERTQALGWVDEGVARTGPHAHAGPFKTDMLIQPAVLVDPRRRGPAEIVFPGVSLGETLTGWVAIDDDAAKQNARGHHELVIDAATPDGAVITLSDQRIAHRPGRVPLAIDTTALTGQRVDLRVTVRSTGKAPPPLAFDLDLGAPGGDR